MLFGIASNGVWICGILRKFYCFLGPSFVHVGLKAVKVKAGLCLCWVLKRQLMGPSYVVMFFGPEFGLSVKEVSIANDNT